jgi:hypothetical protein
MTYETTKALGNRDSVSIVEIDLDINNPAVDFSSDPDSYNTPSTTISPDAQINISTQTYIFSDQQLEYGVNHFAVLDSVSSTPATLKPGEDVALSASASANFNDITTNDAVELPSPYNDRRVSGSLWGKLEARNYFQNREARVKRGYDPLLLNDNNFQIENYVVKSLGGLTNNGTQSVKLIDRLFFATEGKAKAPVATDVKLTTTMTTGTTSINFTGTSFGDKEKSRTIVAADVGMILIGGEIMSYTVASYSAGSGTLTVVRAQGGTVAEEHAINETIQGCFITEAAGVFGAENITDIARRLFNDFTDIGTGYINDTDWDTEKAGNLSNYDFTNIVTKPTDVRKLLKEMIQSSGAWMYFDIIDNEIVIGASARFDLPVATLTEDANILEDSMKVTPLDKSQVTRSTIRYNKLNYAESDDEKNFGNVFQKIDGIQEGDAKSGKQSEAKEIKSNWYTGSTTDIAVANSVVNLNVERNSEIPHKFTFNLDAKDVGILPNTERLWYGSVVEIYTRLLLNPDGTKKSNLAQVTSVKPLSQDTFQVTALSYAANIPTNVDLYIDTDKVDYLLTSELTTTEAREYVVVINSGVIITASATSADAFDTGTLFAGATLKLINQGFIVGASGAGGAGSENDNTGPGIAGSNGGPALNIQVDTTLDNLTGLIGGGGGGGGGGGSDLGNDGGGGGGGAGDVAGAGGGSFGGSYNGEAGSFNFPGAGGTGGGGGDGGTGGDLGASGDSGVTDGPSSGGAGGTAGKAIDKNGNTLTILSGNNAAQIKGVVS